MLTIINYNEKKKKNKNIHTDILKIYLQARSERNIYGMSAVMQSNK